MIENYVNAEIIGKIMNDNNRLLGTCFLFTNEYIFTARHVVEDYIDASEKIICYFEEIEFETHIEIEYDNEVCDIAVLKCKCKLKNNMHFYNFAISEAEDNDNWKSKGYPAVNEGKIEYLNGNIRRILKNNPCTVYELTVYEQKENVDWEGLSGAPLIIDNEIAGLIIRETESNIKTRLKAMSFLGVFQILEDEKREIVEKIKSNYEPILKERMVYFEESINEIFYEFSLDYNTVKSECFVLKSAQECLRKLIEMISLSIRNYGTSLITYKKSKQGNYNEKLKADKEIDNKRDKILKLISNNEHLAYVLLWTLVEGAKHCPRIGSRILDDAQGLDTDIYVDESNGLNIYFSYGKIDGDFFDCFKSSIQEIDKYICKDKISLDDEIISWDELAISSLNYYNRKKIRNFYEEKENIKVGVFVISSFEYYGLYQREDKYDEKHDYELKRKLIDRFLVDNNKKIKDIIAGYNWISQIDIKHFALPFNDYRELKIILEEYL